jgi:hypothetical protein
MTRSGVILAGLLVSLAIGVGPASAADVNFQVRGTWVCNNRGTVVPVAGARVELWGRLLWFGLKLGDTHTGADGSFGFGVGVSSNFDLYAKLVLNDDSGVRLSNWYSLFGDEWNTNTGTTRSHSGVVNLGTWQISRDGGAGTPKCAIWQGGHNAYRDYRQVIGSSPPYGTYSISADFPCCGTPFTTLDTTRWPSGYQTGLPSGDPDAGFSVSFHEFAHSVRHSFDGGFLHFLGDVASYGYAQNHDACNTTNPGFAFNEGWAEYWAKTLQTCGDGTNFSQEGNVATALAGLERCADRPTMVRILRDNPGAIHSYAEFGRRFFALVGPLACIIAPTTGTNEPEPSVSPARLVRGVRSQISAQKRLIARLSGQMPSALRRARHPGSCTTAGGCLPAIQRIVGPIALRTQVAQARLVLGRLRAGLAAARRVAFNPDFAQPDLYAQLEADRQAFERANQGIVIAGLKRSIGAVRSRPGFGPATSTRGFQTLSRRLSLLRQSRRRGRAIPSPIASLFAAPAPPVDVARRAGAG